MERKFCGKCGKPIAECTCRGTPPSAPPSRRSFDNIALAQGEVVVRQYHIGKFEKSFGLAGNGNASVIITNKRVISKQDSDTMGASSTSVEEVNLENVLGVKNFYAQGYTIWRILLAICWGISGLITFISAFEDGVDYTDLLIGLVLLGLAVYMGMKARKPSYYFSVYASSTSPALTTGANLRGKLFNSNGYGLVFQYKPTKEAVKMMCEMGACIMDLKNKGDYAVEAWKEIRPPEFIAN